METIKNFLGDIVVAMPILGEPNGNQDSISPNSRNGSSIIDVINNSNSNSNSVNNKNNNSSSSNVAIDPVAQLLSLPVIGEHNNQYHGTGPSMSGLVSHKNDQTTNMYIDENESAENSNGNSNSNSNTMCNSNSNGNPNNSDPTSKYPCKVVNNLLSRQLMHLSSNDRTSINEELHGVRNLAIEENGDENSKERVSNALFELNQTLEHRIPVHQKAAFLKAQSLQQTTGTYVNDVSFRLQFLRSKLFNVAEAARLLVNYLELVRELYGDVCLSRPIRLEDIQTTKEERVAFRAGYIQLLPFGDRAGRRILMITTDALSYSTYIRVRTYVRLRLRRSIIIVMRDKLRIPYSINTNLTRYFTLPFTGITSYIPAGQNICILVDGRIE